MSVVIGSPKIARTSFLPTIPVHTGKTMNQKCGVMTMKFRSKTGQRLDTSQKLWEAILKDLHRMSPREAARLMGYEVVEDDAVEGMCCDCAHGGPCCSPDENANCSYRKEDGTCWVPYTKETTMQCYREGGCGPYEGRSCTECPASKPEYLVQKILKWSKSTRLKPTETHEKRTRAIENTRVQSEEANMDKPLKDWTLGEVQEYCRKTDCEDCIFDTDAPEVSRCPMAGNPSAWSFIRKPRFTQQEVEDAKAIKRVLKATGIRRNRYDNIYATGELIVDTLLDSEAFPSLQPDTAVTIDEIIGGAQ